MPDSAPRIIGLLNEFESADAAELATFLNLHEGNVRKHLRLMERVGLVVRRNDGQWQLRRGAEVASARAPATPLR